MPLILPGNVASAADTAYEVANSCRFNDGDSAYMTRAFDATQTSTSTFTISVWVKRGALGTRQSIFAAYDGSSEAGDDLEFETDDTLSYNGSGSSSSKVNTTSAKFRDPSAWLHIVVARNSGATGASNQVKIYVNGVLQTLGTNGGCDTSQFLRNGLNSRIGVNQGATQYYVDMYMAEFVAIDGQMLDHTSFGEFDEDSPTIWKPKDVSGLTFGTNGFYLDFEDSGDLGDDESGNTNDFTETNLAATDSSTDTPTNNFCTINPLAWKPVGTAIGSILSEANGLYTSSGAGTGNNSSVGCTIGFGSGKFYWEAKTTNTTTGWLGVTYEPVGGNADSNGYMFGSGGGAYGISTYTGGTNGEKVVDGSQTPNFFTGISANDIMSFAYDLDNGYFYLGVNGTYVTSGDPTSGSSGTGAIDAIPHTLGRLYYPIIGNGNYGASSVLQMNFGACPTFTISSGNADGNGYGNFEYAPPSGYYALCTKNLAEFG